MSCVCEALKYAPMEGSATFAIANGRLATAATMMSVPSTNPALAGADESPAAAAPPAGFAEAAVAVMVLSPCTLNVPAAVLAGGSETHPGLRMNMAETRGPPR